MAIGTKWSLETRKISRGILMRQQGKTGLHKVIPQEEGINYDEVFAPVARIKQQCLLYGTIEEEVYVCQPPSFEDLYFPDKVYKVEKSLYGLYQAPRAWYETLSTNFNENGFRRGLLIRLCSSEGQSDICLSTSASTPMEPNKALVKDEEADNVDVHLYRSMIGSLMYLTASRLDIMFVVCACQAIVANSTTEAEYVATAHCCGQVGDEVVLKELGDRMERAATTAFSLEAEQDNAFWRTATARTSATGEVELTAIIDGQEKTITEASLRRHLKLEDNGGVTTLPNSEIFEQLALMGYETDSDKLTFQKGNFSPQWRFFIQTNLHCLSPKKNGWE
ncbi:putative ribonuclease H-like domain-containing protein [Tanacetum coccineum]